MRGGLLFFGIMLLLIGAALYFLVPGVDANVRYARDGTDDQLTMVVLPTIGLIAMGLGALLTVLGLVIPGRRYDDDRAERRERLAPTERKRTIIKDKRGRTKRVETTEVRRED